MGPQQRQQSAQDLGRERQDTAATILVIDDVLENIEIVTECLKDAGYDILVARNGEMGFKRARFARPDLILLDVLMPGIDGFETCRQLKADPATDDIPVLFMTVATETEAKVRGFAAGGVDYISKPVQVEEVLARVTAHLTIRRTQEALRASESRYRELNRRLAHAVAEHELLGYMSNALQRCQSFDEAYVVCLPFLRDLFAGGSGALYRFRPTSAKMELFGQWGQVASAQPLPLDLPCATLQGEGHDAVEPIDRLQQCRQCTPDSPELLCARLQSDGKQFGVLQVQRPEAGDDDQATQWYWLATRVVDLLVLSFANIQLRESLREQSIRDPLTGLYNRRFLHEILAQRLSEGQRHDRAMGLILLDIDNFKAVNDTYGHDAGDVVLRELGSLLLTSFRAEDIPCRFGGEELLLVLAGASLDQTRRRAEELLAAIRRLAIIYNGAALNAITASIGIAMFPDHGPTPEALISAADRALYRAKTGGRDQICVAAG